MSAAGSALWRNLRTFQVFGANTNVGKTIFSSVLCRTAKRRSQHENVWYLKPVSTGPLDEADNGHLARYAQGVTAQNLYQFRDPVSPHLAADTFIPNQSLLEQISGQIRANAQHGPGFMLVETAGGPNSPGPSGTLQADLYRPLRLPIVFVADWHLGGISTSISAYESLKIRGYDIEGIAVLKDTYYKNFEYFQSYFQDRDIPLLALPQPPERSADDHNAMKQYYDSIDSSDDPTTSASAYVEKLYSSQDTRVERLEGMAARAYDKIWYPFTQHTALAPNLITAIDSAHGDYFQTLQSADSKSQTGLLQPTVDASASWWTQGVGHANHDLTMAAAYASGRYGHVMFASAVHEPAIELAERLLAALENPRLKRVFYSDNGSTAMEVAVKMALKAACVRYGWDHHEKEIEMLGLTGSYHGDTAGAMDMSEPSIYNFKVQWYKSRGFWFDPPTVHMRQGRWKVEKPENADGAMGQTVEFDSLADIFDFSRDRSSEAKLYSDYIRETITQLTRNEKRRFGALVMEPVILGAGGMRLVDPLFQRTLINTIRASPELIAPDSTSSSRSTTTGWSGLPVVSDEVFTGLGRLGHSSSALSLLGIESDISAHAKLLTGGLLPLAITCASESIFEAFLADGKEDALLHGHSYTAHAIGCAVGVKSLQLIQGAEQRGSWDAFKNDWGASTAISGAWSASKEGTRVPVVWSVWSQHFVQSLSNAMSKVDGVWAIGSVIAIELRDASGVGGYASNAAKDLQQELLFGAAGQTSGWSIHSRVLGNVLYLMTSQVTAVDDVRAWEARILSCLGM